MNEKKSGGMKQRIRVVGILENEEGVLLMKRRTGRSEGPVFWELPTEKIKFGEQPEEAMTRGVLEDLGVEVKELELKDVVTFLAFSESSQIANLYIIYDIKIKNEKMSLGNKYSVYKFVKNEEFAKIRLDEATNMVLDLEKRKSSEAISNYRETANGLTVYVDGSSRGNPGPSGIGFCIIGENGETIKRGGEFIGFATSRVVEYMALKRGIEEVIQLGVKSVRVVGDNLMMINQMNGIYRVKNRDLLSLYGEIKQMVAENFEAVAFVHVKREENVMADREANLAIDRHFDMSVIR